MRARIGAQIKEAIETKGLSQAYVAQKLGVGPSTISKWCSGETSPDLEIFRELARLTWTSPSRILLMDNYSSGAGFDEAARELEGMLQQLKVLGEKHEALSGELGAFLAKTGKK